MIAQAEDMKLDLECFAQEAADKVVQLWNEGANVPLSASQKHGLVDCIWECLLPGNRVEAESDVDKLVHST